MNDVAADSVRTFTPEEERRLTLQLKELLASVEQGAYSNVPIDTSLLCKLHRLLFDGVRDHAGHARSRHWGSETLTFGPHRSAHRNEALSKLDEIWRKLNEWLPQFEEYPDDPDYEQKCIHVAAWAHAEVIRIHPFEDGNGRTSRLLMGVVLVRLKMMNIPIESCRQEYLDALNHYIVSGEIYYLIDLLLQVILT